MQVIFDIAKIEPPGLPLFLWAVMIAVGLFVFWNCKLLLRAGWRKCSIAYGVVMGINIVSITVFFSIQNWIEADRLIGYRDWTKAIEYETVEGEFALADATVEDDRTEETFFLVVAGQQFRCGPGSDNEYVTRESLEELANPDCRLQVDYAGKVVLRVSTSN